MTIVCTVQMEVMGRVVNQRTVSTGRVGVEWDTVCGLQHIVKH